MRILLLNQVFHPDVAATGQYASDLARSLAIAGHEVTVLCSARGYDDPSIRYPAHEVWNGVRIIRVAGTGMGKESRIRRAADFGTYFARCAWRLLWLGRFDAILALTTPPLISALGAAWKSLRGGRLVYWIMDLNPDEAIEAGWLQPHSAAARGLRMIQNFSLRQSDQLAVLDRFMRDRLLAGGTPVEKIKVVALWPLEDCAHFDEAGRREFRRKHGFEGKFAVMYSGNHSPCHPLDTLLEAARRLQENPDIVFVFVGGGSEYRKILAQKEAGNLPNVICISYQSRQDLPASLSAADLHTVVMGDRFVGILHPSKIYNILAIGTPVLYIGPARSHVTDLFWPQDAPPQAKLQFYAARHGDAEDVVKYVLLAASHRDLRGQPSASVLASKDTSLRKMMEILAKEELSRPGGT